LGKQLPDGLLGQEFLGAAMSFNALRSPNRQANTDQSGRREAGAMIEIDWGAIQGRKGFPIGEVRDTFVPPKKAVSVSVTRSPFKMREVML
jgi:hypothetical protein